MFGEASLTLQELMRKVQYVILRHLPLAPPESQDSCRQNPHEIVNPQICRIDRPQKLWLCLRHLQHLELAGSTTIDITFRLCHMDRMDEILKIHHHHLLPARRA